MTEIEKTEIINAVIDALNDNSTNYDDKVVEPYADDVILIMRKDGDARVGKCVTWEGLCDTITASAKNYAEASGQSATTAEEAKNAANNILEQVQSKGTEITNFVATSKTEIETQKNESVNAVKSVYQTDLNELKGDLTQLGNNIIFEYENNILKDEMFVTPTSNITKNGNEFVFNNVLIGHLLENLFRGFTLESGEYVLYISTDDGIKNKTYLSFKASDTDVIKVNIDNTNKTNIKKITLEQSIYIDRVGFFVWPESNKYTFNGTISVSLIKLNDLSKQITDTRERVLGNNITLVDEDIPNNHPIEKKCIIFKGETYHINISGTKEGQTIILTKDDENVTCDTVINNVTPDNREFDFKATKNATKFSVYFYGGGHLTITGLGGGLIREVNSKVISNKEKIDKHDVYINTLSNELINLIDEYNIRLDDLKFVSPLNSNVIFFDDFNGNKLSKYWTPEVGIVRNSGREAQYYRKENISIENSCLKLTAKKESYGGKDWTSSAIDSGLGFMFGVGTEIEFKYRFENCNDGAWLAIWSYSPLKLLIDEIQMKYPKTLELDFFELWRRSTGDKYETTLHYEDSNDEYHLVSKGMQKYYDENWHTMKIVWENNLIKQYYDGVLNNEFDTSVLDGQFNNKKIAQQMIINFAIDTNNITESTNDEMYMYVDYVKVTKLINTERTDFITISEYNKTVNINDEFTLYVNTNEDNADKTIYLEIENNNIVNRSKVSSVSSLNTFVALSVGTTTITFYDKRGTSAKCVVTVV